MIGLILEKELCVGSRIKGSCTGEGMKQAGGERHARQQRWRQHLRIHYNRTVMVNDEIR